MTKSLEQLGRVLMLLILSAFLEVGGDAGMRKGLSGQKAGFVVGVTFLIAYGFVVNLSNLDFGRLMGLYIAVFFVISQVLAVLVFKERLHPPILVGGVFIVLGACIIQFWQVS